VQRVGIALALAGLILASAGVTFAETLPVPDLQFEVSESLEEETASLRGIDPRSLGQLGLRLGLTSAGPPIRIVLAEEGSPLAERVPRWINGYAYPEVGTAVLLVERVPRYPSRSLEEVLRHEVGHVLIARAAGGGAVPRWFHEGLAMALDGRGGLQDAARFELSRLRLRRFTLPELSDAFGGGAGDTAAAYAAAGAFYRDLERRYGVSFPAALLGRVARGEEFEDAFQSLTGRSPARALAQFSSLEAAWVRWLPFLTSSAALWIGVTLLALLAIKRRRDRDKDQRERWVAEEQEAVAAEQRARHRWLELHRLTPDSRRDDRGNWVN